MAMERRKIGELDCAVVSGPGCKDHVQVVTVLCHGFGAPGEDLVPCAPELFNASDVDLSNVRFVFPAAPMELDAGGMYESRAWWPIDMIKLQMMMATGETRDMRKERPELLETRCRQLREVVSQITDESGIGFDKVVLGGFSQGAMLATQVGLSFTENIGGLIIWSGSLLNEDQWVEYAGSRSGLKVIQSHGTNDPILPFGGAELLRDMFVKHGIETDFIQFPGQHTIPREAIEKAAELISRVVSVNPGEID